MWYKERVKQLTDKQLMVAYLTALGLSEKEIAEALSCSRLSVAHAKRNAAYKLGLDSRRRLSPQFGYIRDVLEREVFARRAAEDEYARAS